MPVSYSLQGRLFRLDCVGTYTTDELKRVYAAALEDPAFPTDAVLLMDVTRSESLSTRPTEEIRGVVEFLGHHANRFGKRMAILATEDIHHSLMRMAAGFSTAFGLETEVFSELKDALNWLSVPASQDT